jgi:tetratricopeptide (TPR) repeat protein
MCNIFFPLAFFLAISISSHGQIPLEKQLIAKVNMAKDNEGKVLSLGQLAEFYTIYRADKKADSVLEVQLSIAEISNDKSLMKTALFGNALSTLSNWSGKETFDKAINFIQKGLDYAKTTGMKDLETVAYLRKASLFRKRKLYDQASQQALLAFPVLDNDKNDSLKTELYLELGDIFLAKGDIASAYTNLNSAFDIAYKIKNTPLLSSVYHHFANLYSSLKNYESAKNSLQESVQLNTKKSNAQGLMLDYIDLFRMTEMMEYLERATVIADSLNSTRYKLFCKKLKFHYLSINKKETSAALEYLHQNQDLFQSFVYQERLNYYIGTAYQYSDKPDSAIKYYLKEESYMVQAYDPSVQSGFFIEMAQCYAALHETAKAVEYYEKAFAITKPDSATRENADLTYQLSKLYPQKNDYRNAFDYSQLHISYTKQLNQAAAQRTVALLAFEREKNKHENDLADELAAESKKREAQYLGISIGTLFLFILLIVFGMFPVSKLVVRMLNFVAFICLFEFIILLIDGWLGELTHHEPLKMWLAKIVIIALLLPMHHSLEHIAVKFLSSQKLQRFRQKFSFKKIFHPSKKRVNKIEKNLEESTLI